MNRTLSRQDQTGRVELGFQVAVCGSTLAGSGKKLATLVLFFWIKKLMGEKKVRASR